MPDKHTHPAGDELCVYFIPVDDEMPMSFKVVANSWQAIGNLLGGYMTMVPPHLRSTPTLPCGCEMAMLVDEEGLLKRLPENERAYILAREPIVGNVILVGMGPISKSEVDMFSLPQSIAGWSGPGHDLPYEKAPWEK